jgi:hypothetical protein
VKGILVIIDHPVIDQSENGLMARHNLRNIGGTNTEKTEKRKIKAITWDWCNMLTVSDGQETIFSHFITHDQNLAQTLSLYALR